ncbi:MAG: transglycosylase SLT domain-containing protein [Deltaproteobacteria bacterium]|nr:transglycosylase SLT domain-containing protein [Deltaproteobacteria bacterium]
MLTVVAASFALMSVAPSAPGPRTFGMVPMLATGAARPRPARREANREDRGEPDVKDYFPRGTFQAAKHMVDRGQSRQAVALLRRLLQKHPDARDGHRARFLLALSLLQIGEYEGAADMFQELVLAYPELRDDHLFYRGQALYLFGSYVQASRVLADVDEEGPRAREAARLRAWSLYKATDFEHLTIWLEELQRLRGDDLDSELLYVLAKAERRVGERRRARGFFRAVWRRADSERLAGKALLELASLEGGGRDGLTKTERAVVLRLKNRLASGRDFDRTLGLLERGLGGRAAGLLRAEVAAARARIAVSRGRRAEALGHLRRAVRWVPVEMTGVRARLSLEEAETLLAMEQERAALVAFDRLAARFSASPEAEKALVKSADILLRTRRYKEAEERCNTLLSRSPDTPHRVQCLWNAGWASFRQAQYEDAEARFESLGDLNPSAEMLASSTYWLGRSREMLGKADLAQAAFVRVLEDYPLNYYAALAESHLTAPHDDTERAQMPTVEDEDGGAAGEAAVGDDHRDPRAKGDSSEPGLPIELRRVAEYMRLGLRSKAASALRSFEKASDKDGVMLEARALQMMTATYAKLRMPEDARRLRELGLRQYPAFLDDPAALKLAKQGHPMKYETEIRRAAAESGVPEHLLFALIRTESGFKADAVSNMRAYGLAQLILPTASRMAAELRVGPVSRARLLYNPALNARLGARYLKSLLDRYDGMEPLAIAAYNAGPAAVDAWRRRRVRRLSSVNGSGVGVAVAADELAEEIAVAETRAFVKGVLARARGYAVLYGGPAKSQPQLKQPEVPPTLVSGPLSEPIDVPGPADLRWSSRVERRSDVPARKRSRRRAGSVPASAERRL